MKTDKEMAHDWAMSVIRNSRTSLDADNLNKIVDNSWIYADAMNAEADKREKEKAINEAESHTEFMNSLSGQISCWSCGTLVKLTDRSKNDGCCPECNVEIEL